MLAVYPHADPERDSLAPYTVSVEARSFQRCKVSTGGAVAGAGAEGWGIGIGICIGIGIGIDVGIGIEFGTIIDIDCYQHSVFSLVPLLGRWHQRFVQEINYAVEVDLHI